MQWLLWLKLTKMIAVIKTHNHLKVVSEPSPSNFLWVPYVLSQADGLYTGRIKMCYLLYPHKKKKNQEPRAIPIFWPYPLKFNIETVE